MFITTLCTYIITYKCLLHNFVHNCISCYRKNDCGDIAGTIPFLASCLTVSFKFSIFSYIRFFSDGHVVVNVIFKTRLAISIYNRENENVRINQDWSEKLIFAQALQQRTRLYSEECSVKSNENHIIIHHASSYFTRKSMLRIKYIK